MDPLLGHPPHLLSPLRHLYLPSVSPFVVSPWLLQWLFAFLFLLLLTSNQTSIILTNFFILSRSGFFPKFSPDFHLEFIFFCFEAFLGPIVYNFKIFN
jgi:hypothetical protein